MDLITFIGFVAIGGALSVPLLYGLATLLGMTHKQFRPIFHRKQPDGATAPIIHDQTEPSIEQHASHKRQGRR